MKRIRIAATGIAERREAGTMTAPAALVCSIGSGGRTASICFGLALVLVAVLLITLPAQGFNTDPADGAGDGAETEDARPLLIDGEKLTFEIRYGAIPAGHASLEVTSEDDGDEAVYRITSTARSNDVVSLFFKVEDLIVSEVDASTYESRYFEKRLREGPYRKHETAYYDGDGLVTLGDRTFEVEPGTRDILSALYYVRGLDLRVGDDIEFKAFEGGKSYDARVKVLRREQVRTDNRVYDCLVVEPEVIEGPFAKTGRMLIWLTDDHLKLPVLLKSKVKIGSFVARLVGATHGGGSS
jgi:hypothetical protein